MAWVNVKWISVKEQLPESEDYVLTYMGGKYGLGLIRMGRYRNNNWEHCSGIYTTKGSHGDYAVTYWMPLPTPPRY